MEVNITKMAEEFVPIMLGIGLGGNDGDSSDSDDDDFDGVFDVHEDSDAAAAEEEERREDEDGEAAENQMEQQTPNVTYDKSLPGAHSYLGSDLEEVRGRTVHDDDAFLSLPLLSLPGVVLVPGQTLPLHIFQPSTVSMIRRVVEEEDKTFGLITSRYLGHESGPSLASIGTTAEVLAIKEENDEASGIVTVRVKAIGRQRFEVKETRRQTDGILMAKVRILPERILADPLEGARPGSYRRLLDCRRETAPAMESGDHRAVLQNWLQTNRGRKPDRFSCANFTWWPPWVYKQFDVDYCMEQVKKELASWNETLKADSMPQDPTDFSYWVAGNLPLDDGMKLHLLRLDCAVQRLRCELSIMQRCTILCCRACELLIANKKDVFSMAVEGPMGAYVNPGGYVHETLSVYKAQGLNLVGQPSTENSWFPGYAWTIAQCRNCSHHMGWKFTAVKKKLQPEKFWGLCRSSLLPGLQSRGDENSEAWLPTM